MPKHEYNPIQNERNLKAYNEMIENKPLKLEFEASGDTYIGAGGGMVLNITKDGEPTFPQGILKGYFAMKKHSLIYLPVYIMAVKLQKARRIKKPTAAHTAKLCLTNGNAYMNQDGEILFTTDGKKKAFGDDLARWHDENFPNRREEDNG